MTRLMPSTLGCRMWILNLDYDYHRAWCAHHISKLETSFFPRHIQDAGSSRPIHGQPRGPPTANTLAVAQSPHNLKATADDGGCVPRHGYMVAENQSRVVQRVHYQRWAPQCWHLYPWEYFMGWQGPA